MFPFWLFTIAWAFVSYAIAAAASSTVAVAGLAAATAWADGTDTRSVDEYDEDDDAPRDGMEEVGVPVSRARYRNSSRATSTKQPRPGYYVLDPEQTNGSGLRRYIYYGPERPATED